ncbi:MAG: F0F1 ATP synthase subunit A [bacterium]
MTHVNGLIGWPILAQAHGEYDPQAAQQTAEAQTDAPGHQPIGEVHHIERHAAAHSEGGEGHEEEGAKELPTITGMIRENLEKQGNEQLAAQIGIGENFLYGFIVLGILIAFIAGVTKNLKMVPVTRAQLFVEILVQSLQDYVKKNLGHQAKDFTPYIAALFLFIWFNNMFGLIPLMKAITSDFRTTIALGLCTFLVVQFHGIKSLGFGGWFGHLCGLPDAPLWMSPLNFFLHTIGELVKPISLGLRLFGNIFGEDMLIAAFVGLGAAYFIPLHFPFFFLAMLTSFVQAMVFTMLACAYIGSMSHHGDHHDEVHGHDTHGHDAGIHGAPAPAH